MSAHERPERPSHEEAEDQAANEIGFRNVDEEADHDERGRQGEPPRRESDEGPG